jgi:hypothetical protein
MLSGAGRVTQVVVYLPSKPEALSSNPSTIKKKKKKVLLVGAAEAWVPSTMLISSRSWWLTPVVLATWEAEIGRIHV